MEVDEEEARAEMKTILKTFPIELELKYDEKFTSESNDEILQQVIPRLIEAMKPSAPNWTYVEQNTPADTNFSEPETPNQTIENLIMAEDAEVSAEMDEIVVIEDSEPTGMEELKPTEMEESEPIGVEESELIGVEESPETEDETDKWYKFVL
ncbi:hypothetical protein RhiirB3_454200 [Rhizophagus irregularis]|nr:hypothetical protein RhiirB3_454200 [Rhizophagus irregularis]